MAFYKPKILRILTLITFFISNPYLAILIRRILKKICKVSSCSFTPCKNDGHAPH